MRLNTEERLDALVPNIETLLPTLMQEAHVPGLSIVIIRGARAVWQKGFGVTSADSKNALTADTVLEAGSLSKPVFAYGALKLCEDGLLGLDVPLIDYVCSVSQQESPLVKRVVNEPSLHPVTMRHILSHTGGFPHWSTDTFPLRAYFPPGKQFSYSGESFIYLQEIIEHITKQPIVEFTEQNILKPLGMPHSSFVWTKNSMLAVSQGHDEHGKPIQKELWQKVKAGASLHCTVTDYAHFMTAVMQPSEMNPFHLSQDTISKMLCPQIEVNDLAPWDPDWPERRPIVSKSVAWGLGWGIQHHGSMNSFWHWGDTGSFRAFAVGFKEDGIGAVLMANSPNISRIWERVLLEAIGGEYPAISWFEQMYAT